MKTSDRLLMLESLAGLSVGDAFGQRFFHREVVERCLPGRVLPPGPWRWTDDTNMALSIVEVLLEGRGLDQDALARSFAARYDGSRGYGPAMHGLLRRISSGDDWRTEAQSLFAGQGSYGNGASMRVAPLGAYFAGDPNRVVVEACHRRWHRRQSGRCRRDPGGVVEASRAGSRLGSSERAFSHIEGPHLWVPNRLFRQRISGTGDRLRNPYGIYQNAWSHSAAVSTSVTDRSLS